MHTEYSNMAFEVSIETVNKWEKKPHKHSFFELVYIKEGKGKQIFVNETRRIRVIGEEVS